MPFLVGLSFDVEVYNCQQLWPADGISLHMAQSFKILHCVESFYIINKIVSPLLRVQPLYFGPWKRLDRRHDLAHNPHQKLVGKQ